MRIFKLIGISIIFLCNICNMNLKAGIDTVEVKDDYRLFNHFYEPLNDSVIITYIFMLDNPDSLPAPGNYDVRLVNYNINSRTFSHTYEIVDSNQYYPHDFVLSADKSRLMLYPTFAEYGDSLYVFNTNDGSLDSIILMPGIRFNEEIKQLSDGKAGIYAESSSTITTEWGKSQKYVGQIDLNNYSSTFYPLNPDFENYEKDIFHFDIIKSYRSGYDKEVILHSSWDKAGIASAPFDSNLIRRDNTVLISTSAETGLFWYNYGINSEDYIDEPIYFQNDRYFAFYERIFDSKLGHRANSYMRQPVSSGSLMGFSKNEEFIFYRVSLDDGNGGYDPSIIVHDFENEVNIDTLIFRVNPHLVIGSRPYDNIKFLNDSIAVCLIRAGLIKFKFVLNTLSNQDLENKNEYMLFPNPVENELNISRLKGNSIKKLNFINYLGEEVNIKKIYSDNNNVVLDVSILTPGLYFLNINNNNLKFIKN